MTISDLRVKWNYATNLPRIEVTRFRGELINDLKKAGVTGATCSEINLIWHIETLTTLVLLEILYKTTDLDFI